MIVLKTNYGAITVELDFEKVPISSANFLQYAEDGFYDGTIFHRVVDNFMIQGGGFDPNITGRNARGISGFELPRVKKIVLLDLTDATKGNATGLGAADGMTP
ncbi:MAG: peptidylprolyl isomerase, partial [Pseudomonadales bacterium]|nr:peptidylprolyl isomerase [Pseudomonadales bacterium]